MYTCAKEYLLICSVTCYSVLVLSQDGTTEITDLIRDAYSKFHEITNQQIDKLRLKYRLKVVQVGTDLIIFRCRYYKFGISS